MQGTPDTTMHVPMCSDVARRKLRSHTWLLWLEGRRNRSSCTNWATRGLLASRRKTSWAVIIVFMCSRFTTIACSRPRIVEGYESTGSSTRRSRAGRCACRIITLLVTSKSWWKEEDYLSPFQCWHEQHMDPKIGSGIMTEGIWCQLQNNNEHTTSFSIWALCK